MNQDLLKKWVDDLRANPALQGTGMLRDGEDHYCCLGRLCVVADVPFVIGDGDEDEEHQRYFSYKGDRMEEELGHELCEELDMTSLGHLLAPDGALLTDRKNAVIKLADLNDGEPVTLERRLYTADQTRMSFAKIADILAYNNGALLAPKTVELQK